MCSGTTVSKSHPEFVVPADSQQDVEEAADDAHVSSLVENLEVESTSRSGNSWQKLMNFRLMLENPRFFFSLFLLKFVVNEVEK